MLLERAEIADVALESGFRRNAFGLAVGADGPLVEPARQAPESCTFLAIAAYEVVLVGPLQVGNQAKSVGGKLGGAYRADTVDEADRLGREKFRSVRLPEDGEAARLVHVGGDLGEEFVGGKPDRDRDAQLALDLDCEARQHLGGAHAMQPLGAGEIEKGFVDRQW